MSSPKKRSQVLLILVFALLCTLVPRAAAQDDSDATYKAERDKAVALFNEQKFLEALPLFEDLSAKRPKDDKVLLGLGACLVSHSATLSDAGAAAKERDRALQVLLRARELGNNSGLLQNLVQILQAEPQGGPIQYSQVPAADEAMHTAEASFARRDYDDAIKNYSRALELDPNNAAAALFVGDSYFAKKDFENAGKWYSRSTEIDPNSETAYRYHADMLTKNGDMEGARTKSIEAVVAEPYNPITWRALGVWADANHVQLARVHINVPNNVAQKDPKNITITLPAGGAPAWLAYSACRVLWQGEKFQKELPKERQYRHSLAEETDCLTSAAKVWTELSAKKPSLPADADMALAVKLYQAGMIEPYILLNGADEGISKDYDAYREKNRAKLELYLSQFVVPPVPAKR